MGKDWRELGDSLEDIIENAVRKGNFGHLNDKISGMVDASIGKLRRAAGWDADTLKTATVDIARETERGIVDMETLRHTNQTLLASLDEVVKIQQEGRQQRAAAEAELRKMEGELKAKLLETVSAR